MIRAANAGGATVLTIDRPERRNAVDLDTIARPRRGRRRRRPTRPASASSCSPAPAGTSAAAPIWVASRTPRSPTPSAGPSTACASSELVTIAAVDGVALGAGTQLAVVVRPAGRDRRGPLRRAGRQARPRRRPRDVRRLAAFAGEGTAQGDAARRRGHRRRRRPPHRARAAPRRARRRAGVGGRDRRARAAHDRRPQARPRARRRARADDDDVADARRRAWSSADLQEGLAAFRDRRPPDFQRECAPPPAVRERRSQPRRARARARRLHADRDHRPQQAPWRRRQGRRPRQGDVRHPARQRPTRRGRRGPAGAGPPSS